MVTQPKKFLRTVLTCAVQPSISATVDAKLRVRDQELLYDIRLYPLRERDKISDRLVLGGVGPRERLSNIECYTLLHRVGDRRNRPQLIGPQREILLHIFGRRLGENVIKQE